MDKFKDHEESHKPVQHILLQNWIINTNTVSPPQTGNQNLAEQNIIECLGLSWRWI